ncbi:MAG: hypothetical protein NTV38_08540 [Chloroflexi bacterium]|nr:hypothetical protein [Chloroflexota bacterium]
MHLPRSLVLSAILVAILLVPLSYYSIKFFRDAAENRLINTVVSQEVTRLAGTQLVDVQVFHQNGDLDLVVTIRTSTALKYEQVVALQAAIVSGINRPVSLKVEQVIAEELNPLVPPTPTPTPTVTYAPTPGPSLTYTSSPTATLTPTSSPTITPSPTPTPALAQVSTAGLPSLQLYQSPDGPIISHLRPGQWLTILYGRQELGGVIWVEVKDEEDRIGWLPEIYLQPAIFTPNP